MKKINTFLLAIGIAGLTAFPASAHRDSSFTFDSTAGMFEDMYDYFKYSPAYLPSFTKNAFWTQLSNLVDAGDRIFNNSASSSYYLIGGQMNLMDMGRGGLMLDWFSRTTSIGFTDFNSYPQSGFGESKSFNKRDLDGDDVFDIQDETYSSSKKTRDNLSNDIYLPYGVGGILGLDLGAALRVTWDMNNPTYDQYLPGAPSFEEVVQGRTFDLQNNNALLTSYDRRSSGSLSYGSYLYRLILSGRSKDMIPNLDVVLNVGPLLATQANSLTYQVDNSRDFAPASPGTSYDNSTFKVEGAEPGVDHIPGTGIGFFGQARADLLLNQELNFTGQLGYTYASVPYDSDAKTEQFYDGERVGPGVVPTDTQTTRLNSASRSSYEGKDLLTDLMAKARIQYLGKGWKLGLGVGFQTLTDYTETTTNHTFTNVTTTAGNSNPANNVVATITGGYNSLTKVSNVSTVIDLPVGLVINILDNLPLRFGARHLVAIQSNDTQFSNTPTQTTTVTVNGNNTTNVTVEDITSGSNNGVLVLLRQNPFTVTHSNQFVYGASWWPNSQIQIDFTGFTNLMQLSNYTLSFNFYF